MTMTPPKMVLVLGGSGFVGRSLLEAGVRAFPGTRWVVPTRALHRAAHLRTLPGVELRQADVHSPQALAALFQGVDAVVNLVAILHGSAQEFERAHVQWPRQLAQACKAAGVSRVVHVSALGVGERAPSQYLRSKARGEAVWRESGLPVTVLRPSVIFGQHDRFINLFAQLQAFAPLMPLAGAQAQFAPVWVQDVAQAILACLGESRQQGLCLECAGPQTFTLAQLVRLAGVWSGHPRPVLGMPEAFGHVQAFLLGLLPGPRLMSSDNLYSMRMPNVPSGQLGGLQSLGIQPASLADVMAPWLRSQGKDTALDRARQRARRG
jgi:uncharacterized protein YbjT (DUF2867 family)